MTKNNSMKLAMTIFLVAGCTVAFADGSTGINAATNEVKSYFDPAVKLMYVVGAVLGIIGGVKVYSKWNQGDPDTTKTAAAWFGSCIFLVVVATILKGFFL